MKGARTIIASLAAATALMTSSAFAEAPAECGTGPGLRDYEAAYKTRARFLEHLFHTSYGCRELEGFSEKVAELAMGWATSNPCRAEGNRAAASDTIAKVTAECLGGGGPGPGPGPLAEISSRVPVVFAAEIGECAKDGREAGKEAAEAYCRPPCPTCFGEPPGEVPLCDSLAALYCKQAFRAYVNSHAECRQRSLSDVHFKEAVEAACAPPR